MLTTASLIVSAPQVSEDAGYMDFVITLSNPVVRSFGIHYDAVGDTAAAGSDFTAVSGDLFWPTEVLGISRTV